MTDYSDPTLAHGNNVLYGFVPYDLVFAQCSRGARKPLSRWEAPALRSLTLARLDRRRGSPNTNVARKQDAIHRRWGEAAVQFPQHFAPPRLLRCAIDSPEVDLIVNASEQAMRRKKVRVACDSLLQQAGRFLQVLVKLSVEINSIVQCPGLKI